MSVLRYPDPAKTGKIKSLRVVFENGDWWEHSGAGGLPDAVALQAARALVADMPGVVVGRVPEDARWGDQHSHDYGVGFNACIAAMLANGEKNDG